MSRRKPRGLRPDEQELWGRVVETATPMKTPQTLFVDMVQPGQAKPGPAKPTIAPFKMGQKTDVRKPQTSLPLAKAPVAMDRKTYTRMKRGKVSPDAKIDLHGMTQDQAHPALVSTILNAHADGKRLVLVVTGKGKKRDDVGPIPVRMGVLKHAVPQWLRQAPLSQAILQVTEASQNYGGSGALFVYLRRNR